MAGAGSVIALSDWGPKCKCLGALFLRSPGSWFPYYSTSAHGPSLSSDRPGVASMTTRNVEALFKKDWYCIPPKFGPLSWIWMICNSSSFRKRLGTTNNSFHSIASARQSEPYAGWSNTIGWTSVKIVIVPSVWVYGWLCCPLFHLFRCVSWNLSWWDNESLRPHKVCKRGSCTNCWLPRSSCQLRQLHPPKYCYVASRLQFLP